MTFSKSIQKRIESQTGEKLFSQAEVDALIAAAYEDAATLPPETSDEMGEYNKREIAAWRHGTQAVIRRIRSHTPADAQNALAEHDVALRDELKRCQKNYGKLVTVANEAGTITAKLEAENAELRSKLGWAMGRAPQVVGWISCGEGTGIWRCFECYATGHSSPDSVEHKADCRWFQTRALLAKSGAPK